MIALDTNVVVRVVTADEPEQLAAALALMRSQPLWLAKTVLLETEWVLRFSYRLKREAIARSFAKLLGYRGLQVEDPGAVAQALAWYGERMDFADALHLASSANAERFATFDGELAAAASRAGATPQIELLRARA